jgi:hypothetical protein
VHIFSLTFEDGGTLHSDLVLRLDGFDRRCDSYHLALDPEGLPEQEDAEKVRLVLVRLPERSSPHARELDRSRGGFK